MNAFQEEEEEEEFYTLRSCNQNGHVVAPEYHMLGI